MEDLLHNPVYHALLSGDAHFNVGKGNVLFFEEEVSPFAGFHENYENGFRELSGQLPAGRRILYANPEQLSAPAGWKILVEIKGLQFVFSGKNGFTAPSIMPLPLGPEHKGEMVKLAELTRPGPFASRTIEFGHYYGIFQDGQLAAMTGQRLHPNGYSEISAVCTHPGHLGKGYAAALVLHQLNLIHSQGQQAFLHVRGDNERAIALYHRLGFSVKRGMNFYFMEKC